MANLSFFSAATQTEVATRNFPFTTIDPNVSHTFENLALVKLSAIELGCSILQAVKREFDRIIQKIIRILAS